MSCETLFSEDLQHQQRIESLTIINPFAEDMPVHEQIAMYDVVLASACLLVNVRRSAMVGISRA